MTEIITTSLDGVTLALTHPDRPLFPDGFTKGELISYYVEVADVLLPHLAGRPITRVRFPQGTAGDSFYEKNLPAGAPPWVRTLPVATSSGPLPYVLAEDRPTLAWLGNLAAVEFHTPQWRVGDAILGPAGVVLDGADEPLTRVLMVDLDPGEGLTIADSATAAILAATTLADLGLEALVKSSGNKGLQLSVPIAPTPCSEVHAWARSLAGLLARRHPRTFVATMAKAARAGLVYVDFGQNLAARNTISPYSVRGVEVPSVATPLTWDEVGGLTRRTRPLRISPAEVLNRISRNGDLWQEALRGDASASLPTLGT